MKNALVDVQYEDQLVKIIKKVAQKNWFDILYLKQYIDIL